MDTLTNAQLQDSLQALNHVYSNLINQPESFNYLNFFFGIVGVLGTLITTYAFYQSYKSKKLQNYVYRRAQIALDQEATEDELSKTKEELSSVEARISDLQKQIKKDLPIEARRAVLKDRLEESLENLVRYFDDVKTTKAKLIKLGEQPSISSDLLKSIQDEIEPRFLIKEKISIYQTLLTIATTLSGLAFAFLSYPFERYVGGALLLLGFPIAIMILQLTIKRRSKDKQKTSLLILLGLSFLGTLLTLISSIFFWIIFMTMSEYISDVLIFSIFFTIVTLILSIISLRLFIKYKKVYRKGD
jgi:DNA repair exonuclease SbcCD ATPase subunit